MDSLQPKRYNMFSVVVFEGGEGVLTTDAVPMAVWCSDEIKRVIIDKLGSDWQDDPVEFTTTGETCGESLEVISDNFAQAIKCGGDGGMVYVVRL